MGLSWVLLGLSWPSEGPSGVNLGPSWGRLLAFLGPLGASFSPSRGQLGAKQALHTRASKMAVVWSALLGRLGATMGPSWRFLWVMLGPSRKSHFGYCALRCAARAPAPTPAPARKYMNSKSKSWASACCFVSKLVGELVAKLDRCEGHLGLCWGHLGPSVRHPRIIWGECRPHLQTVLAPSQAIR